MIKAEVLTIGTEITSGEVVNSNAAWVAQRLEEKGIRVLSHLSVRDQDHEMDKAFAATSEQSLVIVTGGLGPTSDDRTRECVARFAERPLEFDADIWRELEKLYIQRGLPLREAHRHQCYFPSASTRLKNPTGTALGFALQAKGRNFFVLPGPPRELEAMWMAEVEPRLKDIMELTPYRWVRWTCLGTPESEVAELVEKALSGSDLEVGYRATVPYVKVKLYANAEDPLHQAILQKVEESLRPFLVGNEDLADRLLRLWPFPELEVLDRVSGTFLAERLFSAQRQLPEPRRPELRVHLSTTGLDLASLKRGIGVSHEGVQILTTLRVGGPEKLEYTTLPYKLSVESERGKRSVAEWVLWNCVRALAATSRQS